MPGVLIRRGNLDSEADRGRVTQRHREETAGCRPRREASEDTSPAEAVSFRAASAPPSQGTWLQQPLQTKAHLEEEGHVLSMFCSMSQKCFSYITTYNFFYNKRVTNHKENTTLNSCQRSDYTSWPSVTNSQRGHPVCQHSQSSAQLLVYTLTGVLQETEHHPQTASGHYLLLLVPVTEKPLPVSVCVH